MKKILLLGNTGQVGWELHRILHSAGELTALDYPQIDMANSDSIRRIVRESHPDLIINTTAYTNVEKAESEPDLAMAINGIGPGILAEEAKRLNAAMIHYSTDFVFDGSKGTAYTEEDEPNPLNVYGSTKLAGEKAVMAVGGAFLIFRTSWVFSLRRPCFVTKVMRWARENETLRIVDDQISSPTWARMLAETTAQVITQGEGDLAVLLSENSGLYHLTGGGACSRFEWAKAILDLDPKKEEHKVERLVPAKSSDFDSAAVRPGYSALDTQLIQSRFGISIEPWQNSMADAMKCGV